MSEPITAVISVSPIVIAAPGRATDLQVRVSAPVTGEHLPIVVFAHGYGSSLDAYAPLVTYWAARGLVVLQPTFLDSRRAGLRPDDPRAAHVAANAWRTRVEDVKRILDHLETLERAVPGLAGRVDRSRVAAAGHSFGAHTTSLLLGARVIRQDGGLEDDRSDPRIGTGVLLCAAGRGGADLSPFAAQHFPYLNQSYAELARPALIVAGDKDVSPLTVRGPDWFEDAYTLSPAPKSLATLSGGEHMLGGISGDRVTETTDESPERVAAVQRLTWAYLQSAFHPGDPSWREARAALLEGPDAAGRVAEK